MSTSSRPGLFINLTSLHFCFQKVFALILTELLLVCMHSFPDLMLSSDWHVFNSSGVNACLCDDVYDDHLFYSALRE